MSKHLMMLAAVVWLVLAAMGSAKAQEYCFDEDGNYMEVPENKQLILVPAHWDPEDIYRESHRAEEPVFGDEPDDEDCLTFGSSGCSDG